MRHYLVSGIGTSHFPVRTNRQHEAIFILEISLLSRLLLTLVSSRRVDFKEAIGRLSE